jgi:Leucine-rich repeat (LRR) protein
MYKRHALVGLTQSGFVVFSLVLVSATQLPAEHPIPGESPLPAGLLNRDATESAAAPVAENVSEADLEATKKRMKELGAGAKVTMDGTKLTEINIKDGSFLTSDDFALFGRLRDLKKLQVYNCRSLNSEMAAQISGLTELKSLALTNTVIDDAAVDMIVKSFPNLVDLDLSSNANMSGQILKPISTLKNLQNLTLVQNRLNEIGTRKLSKLQDLRSLDLRGNTQAGDMTLEILSGLPKLKALKHRSTVVSDYGMEQLSKSTSIENMLIQDFAITNASGKHLAKLKALSQLEIFRCQGFGSQGVLDLKGLNLQRLTLRDLPTIDDSALDLLKDLPKLKKLFLHELSGVTDVGLKNLEAAPSIELLDIWSVPKMTDESIDVIARLPNLKELTVRSTAVTDRSIEKLLQIPTLQTLVFKENGAVTEAGLKRLSDKKGWTKLDIGSSVSAQGSE